VEFEPAKKENCLTYDSISSAVRAEAAPTASSFYVEEEQEEDGVSCCIRCTFGDRRELLGGASQILGERWNAICAVRLSHQPRSSKSGNSQ
jgi:hypothetical protein